MLDAFFPFSVKGARLMGVVEPCGLGDSIHHPEFANELMAQAVADSKLGRMSNPVEGVFSPC